MKTLIITNSYDVTTDLILSQIGHDYIFRLNFDLISDYSIYIDSESFIIRSPTREINENEINKVYWRKPFNLKNNLAEYEFAERKQLIRSIFNILFEAGKAILVNPYKELSIGKLMQLRIAKNYFNVPEWEMILNHSSNFSECITKSLSSSIIQGDKVLYTTKVNTEELDLNETWHLQKYIEKEKDLTVVYINGELFAFELKNTSNQIDWREDQIAKNKNWQLHKITSRLSNSIIKFMVKLNLNYGRLDFVIYKNEYFFLEVNINGQWAFLDPQNEYGLLSTMSKHIHPLSNTIFLNYKFNDNSLHFPKEIQT
jgi:penicillin-binding protein-related factor A (putative recombinase)